MIPKRVIFAVLLLATALAASPAGAEDAETRAKALLAQYKTHAKASRDISDDPGWIAFKRRLTAIRTLGSLDCPTSRGGLLRVVRRSKAVDDRLLAAQGLARSADVDTVRSLLEALGTKSHEVLTQGTAEALGSNKHAAVRAWLAKSPLEVKNPSALAAVLRAGREVPLDAAPVIALFDEHEGKPASISIAFDALRALGRASEAEAGARVIKAAGHADMRLRLAAADVLPGRPRTDALDAATRKLLGDDNALVRYALLIALGAAKAVHVVPEISERLADDNRRTRKTALDVLKRISGKDFGFDMGAWRRWHKTRDAESKPGTLTVPSYHGMPLWSDRLAFVLDKSGSMLWPGAASVPSRMDVAKAELQRVLAVIPDGTLFNAVAFDAKVASWKKSEAVAAKKTVGRAQRWVAKQTSERGANTNTYGVLQRTLLQNPTIDTIYFLSDGIPEWGDVISEEGMLAAVRHWNRYRRVTMNTFAITNMGLSPGRYPRKASMTRAEKFMRALAAAGGGSYRFVRAPAK